MIHVSAHKRERKPKASYAEMFDNLLRREVVSDTLADKDKNCPVCGTQMVPIETETVRTELVFHPAYPERVDYLAATYECPSCKDSLEPQFVNDEGALLITMRTVSHSIIWSISMTRMANRAGIVIWNADKTSSMVLGYNKNLTICGGR